MRERRERRCKFTASARMRDGKIKAIEITSAGVQFGGEESNQRQTRPLAQPKRTKKLVASMLERGLNAIESGDRQGLTSN